MVVVELLVEELVVLAARENHTMVCFRLNLEDTLWKTNISWLEYPHVQKEKKIKKVPFYIATLVYQSVMEAAWRV